MVYMCRLLHDDMKDSGLLPVLARLVKAYSARHSPRAYAVDLVVALHTTLRLLTRLNTSGGETFKIDLDQFRADIFTRNEICLSFGGHIEVQVYS